MHKTRSSVRVWCYSLPPSLLRRPSSAACSCSTLHSQLATLNSQLSTRNSRATLALLRNSCSLASSARPRLGLRRYRAFVRPGIFSAPSLSSASACPLPAQQRQFTVRVVRHPTPGLEGRGAGRAPGEGGHFLRFYALRAVSSGSGAQRGAAGSGGSWVASPICPRIRPFFRARSGRRPFRAFSISAHFFARKKSGQAFSTSPRKNFPGRNWCPSGMPRPRRCAACVVAGAPPAAASAPTGLVVRGWCSIQSCKTVCGFYRWPSRKHTLCSAPE